jgi:hypothetical protein
MKTKDTDIIQRPWHAETNVVSAQEAATRTGLAGSDVELLLLLASPRSQTLVARSDDVFVDLGPLQGGGCKLELTARHRP